MSHSQPSLYVWEQYFLYPDDCYRLADELASRFPVVNGSVPSLRWEQEAISECGTIEAFRAAYPQGSASDCDGRKCLANGSSLQERRNHQAQHIRITLPGLFPKCYRRDRLPLPSRQVQELSVAEAVRCALAPKTQYWHTLGDTSRDAVYREFDYSLCPGLRVGDAFVPDTGSVTKDIYVRCVRLGEQIVPEHVIRALYLPFLRTLRSQHPDAFYAIPLPGRAS